MSIGDSITLIGCLAGLMAALPALIIFLNMVFNHTTERAAYRLAQGSKLPFFVGLFVLIGVGVPAILLMSLGSVFQLLGFLLVLGLLLWAFAGLGVVARLLGYRIGQMRDHTNSHFVEILIGTVVLVFAIAFPLVGWIVVFPLGLVLGVGALTLARFSRPSHDLVDDVVRN